MINLIPTEERKKINKILYTRLSIVFFIMLGISLFLASLMIMPIFIFSSMQKKVSVEQLETQRSIPPIKFNEGVEDTIKVIDNKLNLIEKSQENKFLVSEKIINKIISKKTSGIKITEVNYYNDINKGRILELKGNATTREILLSFKNILEGDGDFKKVDLPVSNFIKGKNIQFNLILMPS